MTNNEDNDNTSVRSIITDTKAEQNELESIVRWNWDESKLTEVQVAYKREFLDKHPELDALVVQAYRTSTIEVDPLPTYYKSAEEIANFVKQTDFADLHNNRQGLGTSGVDNDYVFLPTPESNDLYPYLVAKAMDFYHRIHPHDQIVEIPEYESFYFERMTSQANDLTKHEEEHLGQFRAICHENAMAGIEINETPRMGIRFALKVRQPFNGKNYTPDDPMYASLEVGGCIYRERQPLTAPNQRHLTAQEARLVSDAPTSLSAGDVKNVRYWGMR